MFCSARGSVTRVASPRRSPSAAWHDAHFAAKYAAPAVRSPTTTCNSTGGPAGGDPCPRIVATTLCRYAPSAATSSAASGKAGMPRSAREPFRIGSSWRRRRRPARRASGAGSVRQADRHGGRRRDRPSTSRCRAHGLAQSLQVAASSRCWAGKVARPPRPPRPCGGGPPRPAVGRIPERPVPGRGRLLAVRQADACRRCQCQPEDRNGHE